MDNQILWQILLQVVLIALNAVFACAEIAVISMNDNKLAQLAREGDRRAVRLAQLTSQPARFLATIQVAITLSGFLGSAFAADNFSDKLVEWMAGMGAPISLKTLDTIAVILITLILSYFTLVFGELVPKRIAMKKAEPLALGMSALISLIAKLFAPLVWFLTASTNGMLRLCGIDPDAEDEAVSEEEIRMMVDVGSEKGVIDLEEKEMIQNIFEFDDLSVSDFATHRKDISLLWMEESEEAWEETINSSRHTLYPICEETIDNVVGILNVKDYFRLENKSREQVMAQAVRPAHFIPEGIRASVLFRRMKDSRDHFAVVIDEYGGMDGIVTMNDLLEQLVGDLKDELGEEKKTDVEQLDLGIWKVSGNMPLEEAAKKMDLPFPVEKYDTFSGFVFGLYGSIPSDGSELEVQGNGFRIKVTEVRQHRVEEAIVYSEEQHQQNTNYKADI